jgi:hypothetical protein
MAEFYEFHDSYLEKIERNDGKLILRLEAYRHSRPDGFDVDSGTGWMQPIEITIREPKIENEIANLPVRILTGRFQARTIQAIAEDIIGDEIPSSLTGATDVEIEIEGLEETTYEYNRMMIRGKSASITHKGKEEFVEKLPMWKVDQAEKQPQLIGIGCVDFGPGDLATNKKHMEGFGQKSMGREDK